MQPTLALGCGVLFAVVCHQLTTPTPASTPPVGPGHLALVVEGDVHQLTITHAVGKPDAWGGVPAGTTSDFALRIIGADGGVLTEVPVDLSRFDTDPAHVGKPLVVTGCQVRDTRIALLVNVPDWPGAASYTFVRGQQVVGEVAGETVRALVAGGRR